MAAAGIARRRRSASSSTAPPSPPTPSSSAAARGPACSPPRASATCSRSGACGSRASTTSTSSGRRRWSRAAGGARSASASSHRGEVLTPLDRGERRRRPSTACSPRASSRSRSCLLHAYANAAHEQAAAAIVRERAPGVALTLSSEILPEIARVRAHQHHRHQRLRDAGDGAATSVASRTELRAARRRRADPRSCSRTAA